MAMMNEATGMPVVIGIGPDGHLRCDSTAPLFDEDLVRMLERAIVGLKLNPTSSGSTWKSRFWVTGPAAKGGRAGISECGTAEQAERAIKAIADLGLSVEHLTLGVARLAQRM